MLTHQFDDLIGAEIDSHINHLEPGPLHHTDHQVLTDIVKITENGTEQNAPTLEIAGRKMRFEQLQPIIHGHE